MRLDVIEWLDSYSLQLGKLASRRPQYSKSLIFEKACELYDETGGDFPPIQIGWEIWRRCEEDHNLKEDTYDEILTTRAQLYMLQRPWYIKIFDGNVGTF